MTEKTVSCLTERYWDTQQKKFSGTPKRGKLIAVSAEGENGETKPVGIVLFEDNSISSVPVEFITNINE